MSFDVLTVQQLRHRQADIPLLVLHFGRAMTRELDWGLSGGCLGSEEFAAKSPLAGQYPAT
jgi:transcriptional regulator with AAA-type ATPase domain